MAKMENSASVIFPEPLDYETENSICHHIDGVEDSFAFLVYKKPNQRKKEGRLK